MSNSPVIRYASVTRVKKRQSGLQCELIDDNSETHTLPCSDSLVKVGSDVEIQLGKRNRWAITRVQ